MNTQRKKKSSDPDKCVKCANRVPVVCFFSNLTLAVFKMSVGVMTGSKGLFADGIHSLSDVVATTGVIISLKISDKEDDEKHPYGYGKIEFISCVFVYAVLFLVAIFILVSAIKAITIGNLKTPGIISLFSALVSIVANVVLYRLGLCAGRAINSPAIIANANENKADMLSSIAVVFGIISCHLGFIYGDAIAAIFVGLIILKTSTTLGWKAIGNLIDTSLAEDKLQIINERILRVKQVKRVNYIKARRLGKRYWIDIEIQLSPELSMYEGDIISQTVRTEVMKLSNKLKEVAVIKAC